VNGFQDQGCWNAWRLTAPALCITAPTLRIDNLDDEARLADTIAALWPQVALPK
jgi:hypothetical protein